MGLFSSSAPIIDPRTPFAMLDDLVALFTVEPRLSRLSFDCHWSGWHDEHPPANPRMMLWVSAWVGPHNLQTVTSIAVAQTVERAFIDRGLMVEPEEGYSWNNRNTLKSVWKRKDIVKAWDKEAKFPLTDPNRLALLQTQALCDRLNTIALTPENLTYHTLETRKILESVVSVPEVPHDPPNVPSPTVLHLRRGLHTLRGDPALERLDALSPSSSEEQTLYEVSDEPAERSAIPPRRRR